jgi:hypothetical protein
VKDAFAEGTVEQLGKPPDPYLEFYPPDGPERRPDLPLKNAGRSQEEMAGREAGLEAGRGGASHDSGLAREPGGGQPANMFVITLLESRCGNLYGDRQWFHYYPQDGDDEFRRMVQAIRESWPDQPQRETE